MRRALEHGDAAGHAWTVWPRMSELETQVRYRLELARAGGRDVAGRHVLDAGCGFGFALVVYACAGAASVRGLELLEERVRAVRALQAALPAELSERIEIDRGDVGAMPYADASFDLVVSNEAVGTHTDPTAFCREAARVLRPGGTIAVAELNNVLNPLHRRQTHDIWEAYERGPAGAEVHGHRIEDPFVAQRERIIAARFPAIDPARATALAAGTFAMTEAELVASCRSHLESDVPAPSQHWRRGLTPVDPAGVVPEGRVNPYALVRELRRQGLRATVRGYWGGADGRAPLHTVNRLLAALGPLTIPAAPQFRVVGVKQ